MRDPNGTFVNGPPIADTGFAPPEAFSLLSKYALPIQEEVWYTLTNGKRVPGVKVHGDEAGGEGLYPRYDICVGGKAMCVPAAVYGASVGNDILIPIPLAVNCSKIGWRHGWLMYAVARPPLGYTEVLGQLLYGC